MRNKKNKLGKPATRRSFIKSTGIAAAGILIAPNVFSIGRSPAEMSERLSFIQDPAVLDKQRQESQQIVASITAELASARKKLAQLHKKIDSRAKHGKFVDVARIYATALTWSADDIQRCLEADEFEIVSQSRPLMESLKERLNKPQQILDRILDKAPDEADTYYMGENPYFKSIVDATKPKADKETTYAKGRKGYLAVPNAWTFSEFGNNIIDIVWLITKPRSPRVFETLSFSFKRQALKKTRWFSIINHAY